MRHLIRVFCRVCGTHSTHRGARIRMAENTYMFTCPTCRELRVKPMDETSRGMLLLGGAYPPVKLPNVLAFVTLMQEDDCLAAAVLQEVAA